MSSFDGKTDEEIVAMVQKGNVEAFGALMERYERKILNYGKKFLNRLEDTEDLTQEIFLKVYANIKSFDTNRRFSPWVYRIAHNEFVNALRKKSWDKIASLFDFDTLFPHLVAKEKADDAVNKKELERELDQYLAKLDAKYREPLILFYYENMDYGEIADVLKIPVSTVGVRLRRAKMKLRDLVKEMKITT